MEGNIKRIIYKVKSYVDVHFNVVVALGTFLFNNEWQREQSHVKEKTTSLWSYTNREEMYIEIKNPLYEKNDNVIFPSASPLSLVRFMIFLSESKDWDMLRSITRNNSFKYLLL